jgi:hypothetical protein
LTTIVTRAGKGSPLTNNEVDTNFTNLNTAKIETLTSTDTSVTITGTGSSRDLSVPVNPNVVSGPASATDNAVVRFDGTTGKLVQNSTAATIDDSGNADFLSQKADYFDIDTAATTAAAVGRLRWNATKGTAVLGELGGNLDIAVGQTLDALVTNAEAITITKGQPVYLFSATGDRASVKLAYNTSDATSAKTFGIAAENITAGATGLVRCVGVLEGLNLGTYTAGDTLYLGATAGTLTATKPAAPNHLVYVGLVERANNGNGLLYVRVQNGYELDEIHDVQITSPANGNLLIRDQTNSLWKNANLTAGTGISVTNAAGSITVANTGVTSVTGTAPVVSSGGATPAISMAAATTSVNGYLTSTDWNTFNNKQPAGSYLTSAVTSATAGTGISVSASTGAVTFTNTAPDQTVSIASGTGVSITGTYPNFTAAIGQAVATSSNVQFNSLGVGTAGSGTAGEIRATNNVTAYYSDDRLKTKLGKIEGALDKLCSLEGFYYEANEIAQALGYKVVREVGISAQATQAVLPEIVAPAPIDDKYLTVRYERFAPLFIEAIKELRAEIAELKAKLG